MKKFVMSFIATIISLWFAYRFIAFFVASLLAIINVNFFVIIFFVFFLPGLTIFGISIYFFLHDNKQVGASVFISGLISCLILGYGTLWTLGEMSL